MHTIEEVSGPFTSPSVPNHYSPELEGSFDPSYRPPLPSLPSSSPRYRTTPHNRALADQWMTASLFNRKASLDSELYRLTITDSQERRGSSPAAIDAHTLPPPPPPPPPRRANFAGPTPNVAGKISGTRLASNTRQRYQPRVMVTDVADSSDYSSPVDSLCFSQSASTRSHHLLKRPAIDGSRERRRGSSPAVADVGGVLPPPLPPMRRASFEGPGFHTAGKTDTQLASSSHLQSLQMNTSEVADSSDYSSPIDSLCFSDRTWRHRDHRSHQPSTHDSGSSMQTASKPDYASVNHADKPIYHTLEEVAGAVEGECTAEDPPMQQRAAPSRLPPAAVVSNERQHWQGADPYRDVLPSSGSTRSSGEQRHPGDGPGSTTPRDPMNSSALCAPAGEQEDGNGLQNSPQTASRGSTINPYSVLYVLSDPSDGQDGHHGSIDTRPPAPLPCSVDLTPVEELRLPFLSEHWIGELNSWFISTCVCMHQAHVVVVLDDTGEATQ